MSPTTYETIAEFLRRRFQGRVREGIRPDESLFTSGIVDSFGVLELVAFLEDSFRITIDLSRHPLTAFDTIDKIVRLVEQSRRP